MNLILENSNFQTRSNIIVPIPMNRKIIKCHLTLKQLKMRKIRETCYWEVLPWNINSFIQYLQNIFSEPTHVSHLILFSLQTDYHPHLIDEEMRHTKVKQFVPVRNLAIGTAKKEYLLLLLFQYPTATSIYHTWNLEPGKGNVALQLREGSWKIQIDLTQIHQHCDFSESLFPHL